MKNFFNKKILNILLFILIILIPIQTRYFLNINKINNNFFEYGTTSIYLLDLYIILFIIYLFFYNLKNKLFILNKKRKTFLYLLIIFNILLNISAMVSIDKEISTYFNLKILTLSIFIFFLSFIKLNIKNIKEFFILSSLMQAIFSIIQFIDQNIIANKFLGIAEKFPQNLGVSVIENNYGRYLRSYGFFTHPNILGIFLLIGFIFLIFKIINFETIENNNKNKLIKYFNYYIFGIIFLGIIFTFSRIAIFISILFIIIFFIYKVFYYLKNKDNININNYINNKINIKIENNIKYINNFILIFIIQFIIILIFKDLIFLRLNNDNRLNVISNTQRINQYNESKDIIKNNFLLGVGSRNYTIYKYKTNFNKEINSWDLIPVHNIYLLIFSELGILGFISFLIFLIMPIFIKIDKEIKIVYLFILFSGMFDHFLITENFGNILLFLFIGILISNTKYLEEYKKRAEDTTI